MQILVIEDNLQMFDDYLKDVEIFNDDNIYNIIISLVHAKTKAEGEQNLSSSQWDAAIIDLRLSSQGNGEEGNALISIVQEKFKFPIFVVSSNIGDLDPNIAKNNSFLNIRERNGENQALFTDIANIYQTGITRILGGKGQIESYLNDIFWKHLSQTMPYWIEQAKTNPEDTEKSLLRYTLSHIQEYLEINEEDKFEDYHPVEFYVPKVSSKLGTCDIIFNEKEKKYAIVLTPSCDLANVKAKFITIAQIENLEIPILKEQQGIIEKYPNKLQSLTNQKNLPENDLKIKSKELESKKRSAEETIVKLLNNNYQQKLHYLPKSDLFEGGFIDFQQVTSISLKELNENYKINVTVSNAFKKDIIARFSHYYARQGQPGIKS